MAVDKFHKDLEACLKEVKKGKVYPVYLFVGHSPDLRSGIDRLIEALVPEQARSFNLEQVEGDEVNPMRVLESLETRSFFPGRRVVYLQRPAFKPFQSGEKKSHNQDESSDPFLSWLGHRADPEWSVLVIETASVDRRSRLFKEITRVGRVLETFFHGAGNRDHELSVRHMVKNWVEQGGMRIEPKALEMLIDQVGSDDLYGLKTEVQKLVDLSASSKLIRVKDVQSLVVRKRSEALYSLTEAMGARDLARSLESLDLLLSQGIHPLAILQALANFFRRLILIKSALFQVYSGERQLSCAFSSFQREILPRMKESWGTPMPSTLQKMKPYGIYKLAQKAHAFEIDELLDSLALICEVDIGLKGSPTADRILLERLIMRALIRN